MANEFVHGTVGVGMTQAEFEAIGLHVFNSQATGDIAYASSAIQLSRLAVGSNGQGLVLIGGLPVWSSEPAFLGGKLFIITTETYTGSSIANSGAIWDQPTVIRASTGATANSKALVYWGVYGLTTGTQTRGLIDWDKKLHFACGLSRYLSDAECVARLQLKEAITEGILAAKGIGIEINNLAVVGEGYGTSRAETDLSTAFTSLKEYDLHIIHYPGSKIEWYIDNVLKGTEDTSGNFPTGNSGTYFYLVFSIINGGTGGTDCEFWMMRPTIWQEE